MRPRARPCGLHFVQAISFHSVRSAPLSYHWDPPMRWATTCVSGVTAEEEVDPEATNQAQVEIEKEIEKALNTHNGFLKELDLPLLPAGK